MRTATTTRLMDCAPKKENMGKEPQMNLLAGMKVRINFAEARKMAGRMMGEQERNRMPPPQQDGIGRRRWIVEKRVRGDEWEMTIIRDSDRATAEQYRDKWNELELYKPTGHELRVACWECVEVIE